MLSSSSSSKFPVFHNRHRVDVSSTLPQQQSAVKQYMQSILEDRLKEDPPNLIVGFSGGSMLSFLAPLISELPEQVLNRLRLFPVDERLVPLSDEESNAGAFLRFLPPQFESRVLRVPDELLADGAQAAQQFEGQLRALEPPRDLAGFPMFDLLFLGLGPDGHTCSLFPGHRLLDENSAVWIDHLEDSPKPPPRRITLTVPVLNAARRLAFISNGAGKAEVIKQIIVDNDQQFPPSRIRQPSIEWFIDEEAAKELPRTAGN